MKEKIFCFAQYEIVLLVTSKRSVGDERCREGEGANLFHQMAPVAEEKGVQFSLEVSWLWTKRGTTSSPSI